MIPSTDKPRRILVAGVSGVGKTTLCRRIADATGLPYTEIDSLYHGPGWVPREAFVDDVRAFTAQDRWITEFQYRLVRDLLAARADLLVWLDLPAPIAYWRVITRTIRRAHTKEELWNGNVEPGLRNALFDDEGIIRWAFRTRATWPDKVAAASRQNPELVVVRLRSKREVERWLREIQE